MEQMDLIVDFQGEEIVVEKQQREVCREAAQLFKAYRRELGITQEELGRRVGIPQSNVTRFESGNYNPSLEFLVKMAAAMGKKVRVSLE